MREMLYRVAECGLVDSGFGGVFGVDMLGGVSGTRRNGRRTQGIVARARGERDE